MAVTPDIGQNLKPRTLQPFQYTCPSSFIFKFEHKNGLIILAMQMTRQIKSEEFRDSVTGLYAIIVGVYV